jgi:hypothetical protein
MRQRLLNLNYANEPTNTTPSPDRTNHLHGRAGRARDDLSGAQCNANHSPIRPLHDSLRIHRLRPKPARAVASVSAQTPETLGGQLIVSPRTNRPSRHMNGTPIDRSTPRKSQDPIPMSDIIPGVIDMLGVNRTQATAITLPCNVVPVAKSVRRNRKPTLKARDGIRSGKPPFCEG